MVFHERSALSVEDSCTVRRIDVYRYALGPQENLDEVVPQLLTTILGEDLPTLNRIVDLDALAALFGTRPNGEQRRGGTVTFTVRDCEVTVEGTDAVEVRRTKRDVVGADR